MKKQKELELLAPAGTWAALEAAVYAGADAVYLGGTHFGARAYADNFDRDELQRAVAFAHLYHVKIYVTVNILVDDGELKDLAGYLVFLNNIAVDGIIVQDMGVVRLAHALVPDLPLHASTQMTITNSAGVRFARQCGLVRAVPARELSLSDLKKAAQQGIEIEGFVHGALCVCYSGQCLMSSLIGGRSGNRGSCAQPCRMPYSLVDEDGTNVLAGHGVGPYLLSPKDLSTLDLLPKLIKSGVCSFKIEGRMKRPEYVAIVVDAYRRAIDSWRSGSFSISSQDRQSVEQIFNRGFTTAYLERKPGKTMMSDKRPDNRGLKIGIVAAVDRVRKRAELVLQKELAVGDGVEFSSKKGEAIGATVNAVIENGREVRHAAAGSLVSVAAPLRVQPRMDVYKSLDVALMARAQTFFGEKNKRRIPVSVHVTARLGETLTVEMTDKGGHVGRGTTEMRAEPARNRPLDEAAVRCQVDRLGATVYALERLAVDLDENVIIPAAEINEARRQACRQLDELRRAELISECRAKIKSVSDFCPKNEYFCHEEGKPSLVVWADTAEKAELALRGGADWLVFGGDMFSQRDDCLERYEEALAAARKAGRNCAFSTPRIVHESETAHMVELLNKTAEAQPDALYVHNNGVWQLARENCRGVPLFVDTSLNVFNSQSLLFWREHGATGAVLSAELNLRQIERLAAKRILPLECVVHGRAEMMVSAYCAGGSWLGGIDKGRCSFACGKHLFLQDRKGSRFPLIGDQMCRMHVLNSQELCMLEDIGRIVKSGVSRLRIDGRAMSPGELHSVTRAYRAALDGKRPAAAADFGSCTHGHYYRGVLDKQASRSK